jgi:thiamine pyrophosphate-dependent acetolactate synthase large subunit-like protein
MRVEKPREIKGALQEALSVNDKPVIVEVMSDVKEMAPPAWAP